ncbi:MAG: hypothetical protein ACOY3Y_14435 [Acidobacteriota bacterium]
MLALSQQACGYAEAQRAALDAVSGFHASFNGGRYAEIYHASAAELREAVAEEEFCALLAGMEKKLGKHRRSEPGATHVAYAPGATRVMMRIPSEFDAGGASEDFTWLLGDERPRLVSYNVSSPLLLK